MADNDLFPIVLTFSIKRTPELRRSPTQTDPQGAMLELWLKDEADKCRKWLGSVAMEDSRQVDALSTLRDGGKADLRLYGPTLDNKLPKNLEECSRFDTERHGYAELLIQVGNHRWALPGTLFKSWNPNQPATASSATPAQPPPDRTS